MSILFFIAVNVNAATDNSQSSVPSSKSNIYQNVSQYSSRPVVSEPVSYSPAPGMQSNNGYDVNRYNVNSYTAPVAQPSLSLSQGGSSFTYKSYDNSYAVNNNYKVQKTNYDQLTDNSGLRRYSESLENNSQRLANSSTHQ